MWRPILVFLVGTLGACVANDPIKCTVAGDCIQGGINGHCVASPESSENWCAFIDPDCDGSGLRWGARAGDGLASQCVAGEGGHGNSVSVTVEGDGTGTVVSTPAGIDCGTVCTHSFNDGNVTLAPTPSATSFFEGWGGACTGRDAECVMTLPGQTEVTATFLRTGKTRWLQQMDGAVMNAQAGAALPDGDLVVAGIMVAGTARGVFVRALRRDTGAARWTKVFRAELAYNRVSDIAIDGNGNVIVTGVVDDLPIDFDGIVVSPPPGGGSGAAGGVFLAKLSGSTGAVLWAQAFGHVNFYGTQPHKLAVEADGSIYVGGAYNASFVLAGTTLALDGAAYLAKFTAAGTPAWAAEVGGSGAVAATTTLRALALDKQSNVTIAADFSGEISLGGIGYHATGSADVVFAKFARLDGSYLLHDIVGSAGADKAVQVRTTTSGTSVMLGTYEDSLDLGSGTLPGHNGFFVLELSAAGSHVSSFGIAPGSVVPRDFVLSPKDDDFWIVGNFGGDGAFGGPKLTPAGPGDGFLAKYSRSGVHIFSTRFGGTDTEKGVFGVATPDSIVFGGDFATFAEFGPDTLTAANSLGSFFWSVVP